MNHLPETPPRPRVLITGEAVEALVAGDPWMDPETGVQLLLADTVQAHEMETLNHQDFRVEIFSEDPPDMSAIIRASGAHYHLDASGTPVDEPGRKGWVSTYLFRRFPPPALYIALEPDPDFRPVPKDWFWTGVVLGFGSALFALAAWNLVWGWL